MKKGWLAVKLNTRQFPDVVEVFFVLHDQGRISHDILWWSNTRPESVGQRYSTGDRSWGRWIKGLAPEEWKE